MPSSVSWQRHSCSSPTSPHCVTASPSTPASTGSRVSWPAGDLPPWRSAKRSSGGAEDNMSQQVGECLRHVLSPLRGLTRNVRWCLFPGLTPWAKSFRPFGAGRILLVRTQGGEEAQLRCGNYKGRGKPRPYKRRGQWSGIKRVRTPRMAHTLPFMYAPQ